MKTIHVTLDSAVVLTVILATLCTVFSLENDIPQELSPHHPGWPVVIGKYPRNYELYHDIEAWKRAPSAGFYGMRGKKVPQSNFFGMRGKKGPSGFLGMRGKKMDTFSQLNSDLAPVETFENVWMAAKSNGPVENGRASYSDPDAFVQDQLEDSQQFGRSRSNNRGLEGEVEEHRPN